MANPNLKAAIPLADYMLLLTFEDGEQRVFNVRPYLQYPAFAPLKEPFVFQQVRMIWEGEGVEWPGEIDLSKDTLFLDSRRAAGQSIAEKAVG